MKVLHVIPGISPFFGGPSKVVFEMCRELRTRGVEVQIATTDTHVHGNISVPLNQATEISGVTVWCFRCPFLRKYGFSGGLTKWVREHVKKCDIVHIHAFFSYITAPVAYYAKKHKIPYIIRPVGELDPWCLKRGSWKKIPFYRFFGRPLLRGASAIHVTSQMEWQSLANLGFAEKTFKIPLAVDMALFDSRAKPVTSNSPCQLLFLSRVHPKKGLPLLLGATRRVKDLGNNVMLTVAGNGEPSYLKEMRILARRLRIEKQVNFLGFVDGEDKHRCLAEADVFVLPSYQENFGVAVAEAMAAGLPVIISDQVALAPDVEESGAGRVTPAGSIAALTEAIREIASDEVKREEMGFLARKLVEQRFTWPKVGERLVDLYRAVIQE